MPQRRARLTKFAIDMMGINYDEADVSSVFRSSLLFALQKAEMKAVFV
jgi:hypothetical protein